MNSENTINNEGAIHKKSGVSPVLFLHSFQTQRAREVAWVKGKVVVHEIPRDLFRCDRTQRWMKWFRLGVLDRLLGLDLLLIVRVALHFMKFKRKESFQFFAEPTE